jgi:uncharacterized protein YdaU (DUF1376 family)
MSRYRPHRPCMPLDWTVYLGDTRHLTTLEHGAYLLLIAHYWQHQGLPQDERALARIAGLDAEQWASSRETLAALFKLGEWKHKRIEAELTEAARLSRAGRKGGEASGAARRKKREQQQQDRTIVRQSFNDPPTNDEALKKEKKDTLEPKGSNDAGASPTRISKKPIYSDSRHELWGEGVPILMQLGLTERNARACIGRWLKDTRNDDASVLGAIQRARDHRVIDPVPWITRGLATGGQPNVAESRSLVAAARRAREAARQRLAGADGLGDGASGPVLRLLPQG